MLTDHWRRLQGYRLCLLLVVSSQDLNCARVVELPGTIGDREGLQVAMVLVFVVDNHVKSAARFFFGFLGTQRPVQQVVPHLGDHGHCVLLRMDTLVSHHKN